MIPLSEARALVLGSLPAPSTVTVPVSEGRGMVLAEDAVAEHAVPPFDNTAMDGYAVRAGDTAGATDATPVRLAVAATVAAGDPPPAEPLGPGEAARIMTGAVMPPGADAVVMVERTEALDGGAGVAVAEAVEPGHFVRRSGEDVAPRDTVVTGGTVLGPAHLGVLAEIGRTEVTVHHRPTVGVLSTGDELVDDGRPLAPGQIRESNRPMLLGAVAAAGCAAIDLGTVADDEEAIRQRIGGAVERCDVLVTSGGVSMGAFDYVKVVLDDLAGGSMRWMQIAIKPAKPFAFGVVGTVPVFGLPGNPVSSLVSFELLARPALLAMAGHQEIDRPTIPAVSPEGLRRRPDGKVHYQRVRLRWDGDRFAAAPVAAQGSHQLAATAGANGLAVLPDGDGVAPGETVPVMVLDAESALGG